MGSGPNGVNAQLVSSAWSKWDDQIMEELRFFLVSVDPKKENHRFEKIKQIFQHLTKYEAHSVLERLNNKEDPMYNMFIQSFPKEDTRRKLIDILEARSGITKKPASISQNANAGSTSSSRRSDLQNQIADYNMKMRERVYKEDLNKALIEGWTRMGAPKLESLRNAYMTGQLTPKDLQEIFKKSSPKEISDYARSIKTATPPFTDQFKSAFLSASINVYANEKKGSSAAARLASDSIELAGSMGSNDQLRFLNQLNKSKLLESFVKDATGYDRDGENGRGPGFPRFPQKGLPNLLKTLAYSSAQDPRSKPLAITQDELSDLKLKMFNSVSEVYSDPKRLWLWKANTELKDGLSAIFREDFDKIWYKDVNENSENKAWISSDQRKRLKGFFQHVLFTKPPGMLDDSTKNFLINHMKDWLGDLKDKRLDDKDFIKKYGVGRHELSMILGRTMKLVKDGMSAAVKTAQDAGEKQAAQISGIRFLVHLGLGLIPGGEQLGSLKQDGKVIVEGGFEATRFIEHFLEGASDQIIEKLQNKTKEQVADYLAKNYPGLQIDNSWDYLKEYIGARLPTDLMNDWQSSYLMD